jgi:FMN phosphatase YigB (HAD superfamily)
MSNIKGILIDLDNTFYSYQECHEVALKNVFNILSEKGIEDNYESFLIRYKEAQQKLKKNTQNQAACHNRLIYFQLYLEEIDRWSPDLNIELYEGYWGTFLNSMSLFENFLSFISTAKSKGLKIGIVTDLTAHIQNRKILQLAIGEHIDFMLTSEEAGVEKPTPRIFDIAVNKIGLNRNELIFIGDSFEKDIEGAYSSQITPYWFIPNEKIKLTQENFYFKFSCYKELKDELL